MERSKVLTPYEIALKKDAPLSRSEAKTEDDAIRISLNNIITSSNVKETKDGTIVETKLADKMALLAVEDYMKDPSVKKLKLFSEILSSKNEVTKHVTNNVVFPEGMIK